MLAAVFFDVDGTLAETEARGHRVAYNMAFRDLGLPIEWDHDLYGRLLAVTGGKERVRAYLAEHPELPQLDDDQLEALHEAKAKHFDALVASGAITLRTGVRRLLDELNAEGIPVSIATTSTLAAVDSLLTVNLGPDWRSRFRELGLGDVVSRKKPDPEVYEWLLARQGLEARHVVAIEDSRNGLRAAYRAHIPTLVTPGEYTREEDFSEARVVADSLGDPGEPAHWRFDDGRTGSGLVDLELLSSLVVS